MASLSSIGPNQPAKSIAPNPSTLSRSAVAGKIRYCVADSPSAPRRRSEVQDKSGRARAGDTDHHALARATLDLTQHRVEMVRLPVEDGGLTGAARAFSAGRQHPHARFLHDGQDGPMRGHGEAELAASE